MANILKVGEKFGKLVFLENCEKKTKDGHFVGLFLCECGRKKEIAISRVVNEYTKTCGDKIHFKGINLKHGGRYTKEYLIWRSIKDRVFNKNSKDYQKYSKLGMDKKLANDFTAFLNEVGNRPSEKMSIDRIDNNKGYFPGNLKWSSHSEQQSNKSTSFIVSVREKKFNSYAEAGRYFGVSLQTIKRWCIGYTDRRRLKDKDGGVRKKREDCYSKLKY